MQESPSRDAMRRGRTGPGDNSRAVGHDGTTDKPDHLAFPGIESAGVDDPHNQVLFPCQHVSNMASMSK